MASRTLPSPPNPDTEYSFLEALSIGPPKDQLSLVPQEKLGLATTTTTVSPITPTFKPAATSGPAQRSPEPVANKRPPVPPQSQKSQRPAMAASAAKAQEHCLEACRKISSSGDRISVRMLEYLTSVKQGNMPHGLDDLAHGFLSTCKILLTLQAGLEDCSRTGQYFPADLLGELEKKFRICQTDFHTLEQMLGKILETERKNHNTMWKMKRGLNKLFGDVDFGKMSASLEQTRESLRMSALMFQWTLGNDKIESGMGIGFAGLAAALDRLDQKKPGYDRTKSLETTKSHTTVSQSRIHEPQQLQQQPPLPPLPWSERSTSINASAIHSYDTTPDTRTPLTDPRHWSTTSPSSVGSHDRLDRTAHAVSPHAMSSHMIHPHTINLDHLSTFEETMSHHTGSDSAHDPLADELAALDLGTTGKGAVRIKVDPYSLPRWTPRSSGGMDQASFQNALAAAIRSKNHKLVEQILDRGASPNMGPDIHALNEAVRTHDAETVRVLLCFGADPNERDREGMTPLAAAVEKSFPSGAIMLLKHGADPNLKAGMDQETPMAMATAGGTKMSLAHLLLMYGGDVKQLNADGDTLLISAINKKTPAKLIEILLEYGADPNAKSAEGKTALFEAITCSRVDIVTYLLEHGANPNLPGPKHMLWPSAYKPACLKVLLAHGADSKKCPGVMELATSVNSIDSVRILLKAGVDPNAKKDGVYTPLCTSIRDDRPDIFQLLLSNGANPNVPASEYPAFKCITHDRLHFLPQLVEAGADLRSPKGIIETAVSSNHMEALVWLLDQGLDPNERTSKGHSPLTSAIRDQRTEMVDYLLMKGADPNKRGEDWPLCMAVHKPAILRRILSVLAEPRAFKGVVERAVAANQLESVKLLLAAGVSVEDKNGGVFSPLTTALREDRRDIVRFLIDPNGGNADVNAPGEHLPIVKALRRYHGEDTTMIELLLENGANPNKMYRGWNAMFQAIENCDISVLSLLKEKAGGIDLDAKDEEGRTVLEMAHQRGWDEGIQLLREGGRRR